MWRNIINMSIQYVECVVIDRIDFILYRDMWQALVNADNFETI